MIFLTTTAINLDDEMLNRCLVLTVNEDREQTQAIHRVQREAQTLEGLLTRRERDAILNAAPQRAAVAQARLRCQSLRAGADLPGPPDADAARSHEVSDADPQPSPCCTSISARTKPSSTGGARSSTSK